METFDKATIAVQNVEHTYTMSKSGSVNTLPFSRNKIRVEALKGVSFVTSKGESVGILGRNGSGKSTLLSIIAGALSPTFGNVYVSSRPTLLSVSAALQATLTGEQNAQLGLLAKGFSPEEAKRLSQEVKEWTELGEAFSRPMKTYSSGMKARLKFAIATATPSEILLIDEALSTGDSTFALKARERMDEFLDNSGTVVLVSHSAAQIRRQCERVVWIDQGEVVADGDVGDIAPKYEAWNKARAKRKDDRASEIMAEVKAGYEQPRVLLSSKIPRY